MIPVHALAAGRRRRQAILAFRRLHATAPGSARSLAELSIRDDDALRRLKGERVVRALPDGRLYLDEIWLQDRDAIAFRIGLTIAFVTILIVVIMFTLAGM